MRQITTRSTGWKACAAMALLVALLVWPAQVGSTASRGTINGTGVGTGERCPPGSDHFVIDGAGVDGTTWNFNVSDLRAAGSCVLADAAGFSGPWNPSTGGWIENLGIGALYLGPVPTSFKFTNADFAVCLLMTGCVNGTAQVYRV